MTDWQVTATTIYCEDIDDEVTLLTYSDGTSRCTAQQKYVRPDKDTAKTLKRKGRLTGKKLGCAPGECRRIVEHREKWLGEKSSR